MKTLVIGYGNPLRGDDGLGWYAAQRLSEMLPGGEVQVLACHQLTPELAEPISHAEQVIFIDVRTAEGEAPGAVTCWPIRAAPRTPEGGRSAAFTHHLNPEMLVAWTRYLYGCGPKAATVFSVAGAAFDYAENLSPRVAAALPDLLQRVCRQALRGL